jgi:hypothetical protein
MFKIWSMFGGPWNVEALGSCPLCPGSAICHIRNMKFEKCNKLCNEYPWFYSITKVYPTQPPVATSSFLFMNIQASWYFDNWNILQEDVRKNDLASVYIPELLMHCLNHCGSDIHPGEINVTGPAVCYSCTVKKVMVQSTSGCRLYQLLHYSNTMKNILLRIYIYTLHAYIYIYTYILEKNIPSYIFIM